MNAPQCHAVLECFSAQAQLLSPQIDLLQMSAVPKCPFSNRAKTFRKLYPMQVCIFGKCLVFYVLYSLRNRVCLLLFPRRILQKSLSVRAEQHSIVRPKCRTPIRRLNALKTGTAGKYLAVSSGIGSPQAFGQADHRQTSAAAEGPVGYFFQSFGQRDSLQSFTIVKCISSDGAQPLLQRHLLQAAAAEKRPLFNTSDCSRNFYPHELLLIPKSRCPDAGYGKSVRCLRKCQHALYLPVRPVHRHKSAAFIHREPESCLLAGYGSAEFFSRSVPVLALAAARENSIFPQQPPYPLRRLLERCAVHCAGQPITSGTVYSVHASAFLSRHQI